MYRPTLPFSLTMAGLALLALGLLAGCGDSSPISAAKAQTVSDNLTWTAPTQRVDGSALPASEILQYRILSSKVAGGPYSVVNDNIAPDRTSYTRADRPMGRQCYVMRTVDTGGLVSNNSAEVCVEKCATGQKANAAGDCVANSKPRPPGNVTVQ